MLQVFCLAACHTHKYGDENVPQSVIELGLVDDEMVNCV